MRVNHDICPCCKNKRISKVFEAKSFPAILFPIEKEKRLSVDTDTLLVFSCGSCGHLFLNNINVEFNRNLYRDYYYLYPYSNLETMGFPYRIPFDNVFSFFSSADNSNKRLLEIGCSNIRQLDAFKDLGFVCTGISPGADKDYPATLIDGFYEDTEMEELYDVIVSRFNLEHIIDLDKFMKKVYEDLSLDGLFFIQVPNVRSFLVNGVISAFAHEHPHYFCKESLKSILLDHGFYIECIKATDDDASIIAVVGKPKPGVLMANQVAINMKYVDAINNIITDHPAAELYFYGAGLSLTGLLYLDDRILRHQDRVFVVDDNELLHGSFMPNTDIQIQPPIFLPNRRKSRILFITLSHVYHAAIIEKIKSSDFDEIFVLNKGGVRKFIPNEFIQFKK